jgi:tetratricopeptide (TPR) repeat protein
MQTKLSLFCDKVIEAGWLAALILVPVFFNIYSARTFEPDKLTLMRSIALVMVLAWLIKVAETGVGWIESGGSNETTEAMSSLKERWNVRRLLDVPLFLPTLLLVLAYVISTIFSISPQVALWGSYQRLQGTYTALSYIVIFALVAMHLRTQAQVDRLVTTVILTSLPVGLYGIIQHYGLDPLPWAGDVTSRVAANMGNSIFVASYLIMVIPLTLARLLDSMAAILNEEEASWGHTVLAAVYIFILAVDLITVIFSQSRGPLLGLLVGFLFFIFLGLLVLRRRLEVADTITVGNGLRSLSETAALLGFGGVLGVVWFRLAGPLSVGKVSLDLWPLVAVGILLGGAVSLLIIAVQVAVRRGWSRLWLNWVLLALFMAVFIVSLNVPDSPFLPLRSLPTVGRLTQLFQPGEGSGRVRVLIWQGVLKLIAPHDPLGIPGDELAGPDPRNTFRPLIGYGPESMFNAFARVYPPELAHIEARGSSADRSHNETFDSLATMGILGFLAYYFLMFSLFYYLLKLVGWIPDEAARRRLLVLLGVGGVAGVVIPRLLTGDFVFSGVGLPAFMLLMIFIYLAWQALVKTTESPPDDTGTEQQNEAPVQSRSTRETLLLIGIFVALAAHFIEVHFVFSIAATYVYFWVYAGVVVAWIRGMPSTVETQGAVPLLATEGDVKSSEMESGPSRTDRSGRKRRRRRRKPASLAANGVTAPMAVEYPQAEDWETWLGVWGLVVAIILIAMIFDFVTSQFDLSRGNFSMLWMFGITWGIGLTMGLGEIAVRKRAWQKPIRWGRALLLYVVTSLGYTLFYLWVHHGQIAPRNVPAADPAQMAIKEANIFTGALILFYVFVGLLLLLMAAMLAQPLFRRRPTWRVANWWLYPVLIIATGVIIMFKNVDVVRADMYLKQGEQWRNQGQYDVAITLHQRSQELDSDEDFYDLALAMDYQLKGQDNRISDEKLRASTWEAGEGAAKTARQVNPYNPDNTGNMGRYYLTWAQFTPPADPQQAVRFQQAVEYFEKTTKLAPQNVVYYNLWGQTYYILRQFEQAVKILQTSVELDPQFEQSQMLLGDTYAALGRPDEAVKAHRAAILLSPGAFADQSFDQRLNFYLSASKIQDIISAFEEAGAQRPGDALIPRTLGHIYARTNDHQKAIAYYEQAIGIGDNDVQTALAIASEYLALEDYEKAASIYQRVLQSDPQNAQAHRNLGYAYAKLGRLNEAIQENLLVLQTAPDDYLTQRNLVLLYRDSGRLDEATKQAESMLKVTPENEKGIAYFLLGSLYAAAGKSTEAIGAYQQAGDLYLQQGRPGDALQPFQAVAQLAPNDYMIHQQLATVYQQLKRYDEALAEANQALSLAPEDARQSLQQLIAQIEAEKG